MKGLTKYSRNPDKRVLSFSELRDAVRFKPIIQLPPDLAPSVTILEQEKGVASPPLVAIEDNRPSVVFSSIETFKFPQSTPRALRDSNAVETRSDMSRRLPAEIVGLIFQYAAEGDDFTRVLDLCCVSSMWRAIAVATPSLWNHILIDATKPYVDVVRSTSKTTSRKGNQYHDVSLLGPEHPFAKLRAVQALPSRYIRDPELLALWVVRARALPLHVRIKWSPAPETLPAWLRAISLIKDALETLHLEYPITTSGLEELFYIHCHPQNKVARSFPRLQVLTFSGTPFDERHARIAAKFVSLEVRIYGRGLNRSTEETINKPMTFPSVRYLTIDDCSGGDGRKKVTALLRSTWVPNLHTLTFSNSARYPSYLLHVNAILGTNIPRCYNLAVLNLDNVSFHPESPEGLPMEVGRFERVFRVTPNLKTLRLHRMPAKEILHSLSRDDDPDYHQQAVTAILLPKLRCLVLAEPLDDIDRQSVEPLLRYRGSIFQPTEYPPRTDGLCAPLESVEVKGVQCVR